MNAIEKIDFTNVPYDPTFKWRDRLGGMHEPCDMGTRHLFYAIRMIWNHSAPEHFKLTPYKRYTFDAFYTPEYMARAVKVMWFELSRRDDLSNQMKRELKHMQTFSGNTVNTDLLENAG